MVIVIINLIPKKDCFALEKIPIFSIFGEEKNLRKILQVPTKIGSVRIRATSFQPKRC